jgi:hypothetical protein
LQDAVTKSSGWLRSIEEGSEKKELFYIVMVAGLPLPKDLTLIRAAGGVYDF